MKYLSTLLFAFVSFSAAAQNIPINFDGSQNYNNKNNRHLNSVVLNSPSSGRQTVAADIVHPYTNATDHRIYVKPGEKVSVSFNYNGDWMNGYVFIDLNDDHILSPNLRTDGKPVSGSELVTYSFYSGDDNNDTEGTNSIGQSLKEGARNVLTPPSFTIPASLAEGEHTIRFKVDWNSIDPGGDTNTAQGDFMFNGGSILDATLYVSRTEVAPPPHHLHFKTDYGFFVGTGMETGLPIEIPTKDLLVKLVRPSACYQMPTEITVTVTNDEGTSTEQTLSVASNGNVNIPAEAMVGGNVTVSASFGIPSSYKSTDYQLVFDDEFDAPRGSQPDNKRWERAAHNNNSAWNRFVSTSNKVVYIEEGDLVTRCIPCAPEDLSKNENRPWMSGAVDTRGRFSFRYGRIDVRALTCPFAGSFPAIWLLPDDQSAGWPYYGEIDIWEMINTTNTAYGTVHAARQSQKSGFTTCNYDGLYHIYTLEWTSDQMTWSIDGKTAYSSYYKSSLTAQQLNEGYWPFDKTFYLILNQSVGNGSWASNPVDGHEYETRFDFVRIYQTRQQNDLLGLDDPVTVTPTSSPAICYDLQGRPAPTPTQGLYIVGGKKFVKR